MAAVGGAAAAAGSAAYPEPIARRVDELLAGFGERDHRRVLLAYFGAAEPDHAVLSIDSPRDALVVLLRGSGNPTISAATQVSMPSRRPANSPAGPGSSPTAVLLK